MAHSHTPFEARRSLSRYRGKRKRQWGADSYFSLVRESRALHERGSHTGSRKSAPSPMMRQVEQRSLARRTLGVFAPATCAEIAPLSAALVRRRTTKRLSRAGQKRVCLNLLPLFLLLSVCVRSCVRTRERARVCATGRVGVGITKLEQFAGNEAVPCAVSFGPAPPWEEVAHNAAAFPASPLFPRRVSTKVTFPFNLLREDARRRCRVVVGRGPPVANSPPGFLALLHLLSRSLPSLCVLRAPLLTTEREGRSRSGNAPPYGPTTGASASIAAYVHLIALTWAPRGTCPSFIRF